MEIAADMIKAGTIADSARATQIEKDSAIAYDLEDTCSG